MWREKRRVLCFGWETLRKETTWETRRKWEDNIKMDLQEVGWWVYGSVRSGSG